MNRKYHLRLWLLLIAIVLLIFFILIYVGIIDWQYLWNWLNTLGNLPVQIGQIVEIITRAIAGLIILILPFLIFARVLRLEDVKEILQKLIGK